MVERRIPGSDGIEVYVSESNEVVIKSDCDTGGPIEMMVVVPPEKVDTLVKMLQECRDEALALRQDVGQNAQK